MEAKIYFTIKLVYYHIKDTQGVTGQYIPATVDIHLQSGNVWHLGESLPLDAHSPHQSMEIPEETFGTKSA